MYIRSVHIMDVAGDERVDVHDLRAHGWALNIETTEGRITFFADELGSFETLLTNALQAVSAPCRLAMDDTEGEG